MVVPANPGHIVLMMVFSNVFIFCVISSYFIFNAFCNFFKARKFSMGFFLVLPSNFPHGFEVPLSKLCYHLIIPVTSNLEYSPGEESHTRRGSLLATTHHIIGTDHNQDNMLQEHLACNYHAHVPSQYQPHHDIQHDLHSYHSTCDDHNIGCNYFSGG